MYIYIYMYTYFLQDTYIYMYVYMYTDTNVFMQTYVTPYVWDRRPSPAPSGSLGQRRFQEPPPRGLRERPRPGEAERPGSDGDALLELPC